jgi:hypothetical protein
MHETLHAVILMIENGFVRWNYVTMYTRIVNAMTD